MKEQTGRPVSSTGNELLFLLGVLLLALGAEITWLTDGPWQLVAIVPFGLAAVCPVRYMMHLRRDS